MLNGKWKIDTVNEETGFSATGASHPVIKVVFHVGTHGPFVERIPKAEFTPDVMRAKLDAFASDIERATS